MEGGFHLELCLGGDLGNRKRQQAKPWHHHIEKTLDVSKIGTQGWGSVWRGRHEE